MAVYYVRCAPVCYSEGGKLVIKSPNGDERVMEWSVALPWIRELQALAAQFDAENRGNVAILRDVASGH